MVIVPENTYLHPNI